MGERTKAVLAALSGALAALVEDYGMILLLGCAFISLDLVTGLAKAKISGTVSSAVGRKGFWRKAALLAALAFGICMDKLMGVMIPGFASPVGRLLGCTSPSMRPSPSARTWTLAGSVCRKSCPPRWKAPGASSTLGNEKGRLIKPLFLCPSWTRSDCCLRNLSERSCKIHPIEIQ